MSALVIILMALSSSAPVRYVHAHEVTPCHDGEHADGHRQGASHSHVHPHCHHHHRAAADEHETPAMRAPLLHQHVLWWGLELVMPPTTDDSGEPSSDVDGIQLGPVRSHDVEAVVAAPTSQHDLPPPITALIAVPAKSASPARDGGNSRPECNLLCDAARRACSGVFLL